MFLNNAKFTKHSISEIKVVKVKVTKTKLPFPIASVYWWRMDVNWLKVLWAAAVIVITIQLVDIAYGNIKPKSDNGCCISFLCRHWYWMTNHTSLQSNRIKSSYIVETITPRLVYHLGSSRIGKGLTASTKIDLSSRI